MYAARAPARAVVAIVVRGNRRRIVETRCESTGGIRAYRNILYTWGSDRERSFLVRQHQQAGSSFFTSTFAASIFVTSLCPSFYYLLTFGTFTLCTCVIFYIDASTLHRLSWHIFVPLGAPATLNTASYTVACMKKYLKIKQDNPDGDEVDDHCACAISKTTQQSRRFGVSQPPQARQAGERS